MLGGLLRMARVGSYATFIYACIIDKAVNATPKAVMADVAHLARTRHAGGNHAHLSKPLAAREGIDTGRTTRRRILLKAG